MNNYNGLGNLESSIVQQTRIVTVRLAIWIAQEYNNTYNPPTPCGSNCGRLILWLAVSPLDSCCPVPSLGPLWPPIVLRGILWPPSVPPMVSHSLAASHGLLWPLVVPRGLQWPPAVSNSLWLLPLPPCGLMLSPIASCAPLLPLIRDV